MELNPSILFQIIHELSTQAHSIQLLCHLAKVLRSGYYKWVKRKALPSEKELEDERLKAKDNGMPSEI